MARTMAWDVSDVRGRLTLRSAPAASLQDMCVVQVSHAHLDREPEEGARLQRRPIIARSSPLFFKPAARAGQSLSIGSDNAGSVAPRAHQQTFCHGHDYRSDAVQQCFTFLS